jgi:hypothetical protein
LRLAALSALVRQITLGYLMQLRRHGRPSVCIKVWRMHRTKLRTRVTSP